MIAHFLAAQHVSHAPVTFSVHIRYMAILPVIIMLGGAVALLAVASLVRRPLRVAVSTVATMVIVAPPWASPCGNGRTSNPRSLHRGGPRRGGRRVQCPGPDLGSLCHRLTALVATATCAGRGSTGPNSGVGHHLGLGGHGHGRGRRPDVVFLGLEILSLALYVLAAFNPGARPREKRPSSTSSSAGSPRPSSSTALPSSTGPPVRPTWPRSPTSCRKRGGLRRAVVRRPHAVLGRFGFKVAAVPFTCGRPTSTRVRRRRSPGSWPRWPKPAASRPCCGSSSRLRTSSGRLAADHLRAGGDHPAARGLPGRGPARHQADACLLVDQSRRLHPARAPGGHRPGGQRLFVLPVRVHLHGHRQLRRGDHPRAQGRQGGRHHQLPGTGQPPAAAGPQLRHLAAGPGRRTLHHRVVGQVAGGAPSVDANSVPLAIIAMVSAAIAAFFYLRVAVLMYTPLRAAGTAAGVEADAEDPVGSWSGPAARDDDTSEDIQPSALGGGGATPVWPGPRRRGGS